MVNRCQWIQGQADYYVAYHDQVWGKPLHEDQALFKWLLLESFHTGLSWRLVLSKYSNFQAAFDNFNYQMIAEYDDLKLAELGDDPGIIRHPGKIAASRANAQAFIRVQQEWGSFATYIWNFTQGQVIRDESGSQYKRSQLSDQVAKDMKARGFKFIGSVTIYSYLQAIGVYNHHDSQCDFS